MARRHSQLANMLLIAMCVCSAATPLAAQPIQPATERTPILARWESLQYGMFIHFGLSTFMQEEYGQKEAATCADYRPSRLDVDQWARVAQDAGMKYAVLTTKHCYGHCLWPSQYSDRTVAQSPVKDDVVRLFVTACRQRGIQPGFYYLLGWDNYHQQRMTPDQYEEFCRNQLRELLTNYGAITVLWLDIPWDLGPGTSQRLQRHLHAGQRTAAGVPGLLQPVFLAGHGPQHVACHVELPPRDTQRTCRALAHRHSQRRMHATARRRARARGWHRRRELLRTHANGRLPDGSLVSHRQQQAEAARVVPPALRRSRGAWRTTGCSTWHPTQRDAFRRIRSMPCWS